MTLAPDLLRIGGRWLRSAREWLQRHKHNGSDVTWGSQDIILPHMTVRDCEEMCATAVAADRNDRDKDAHETLAGEIE